jgi:hypothetical protein
MKYAQSGTHDDDDILVMIMTDLIKAGMLEKADTYFKLESKEKDVI